MDSQDVGKTIASIAGVLTFFFIVYGCYWIVKNLSYTIFYEDMVKNTIVEMVKKESLNLKELK